MKILVVDDRANEKDHPRKVLLEAIKEKESIEYDFIEPVEDQLKGKINRINDYSLIIIDYKFDRIRSSLFKAGDSLYSVFRSRTNSTPIYLVSVITSKTNQIGEFDLFIKDEFLANHSAFGLDIKDHKKLKSCTTSSDFIDLLLSPDDIEEDLGLMLKPIFSKPNNTCDNEGSEVSISEGINILLFRWLMQSLLKKEGPLVSMGGAALMLGITEGHFQTHLDKFEDAKYQGLFHESVEDRWWVSLIEDIALSWDDPESLYSTLSFKEASSILLEAKESNYSTCTLCGERYPDSLGIISGDDTKKLYPVHTACSEFQDSIEKEPFFKNPRLIESS